MGRLVLGKSLELFGLTIILFGFFLGITQKVNLHFELMAMVVGGLMFYIGYFLERSFRKD